MAEPIIARGSERAMLDAVLIARRSARGVIVPPAGAPDLPHLDLPDGHLLAFTSGSTGGARGILRTHQSWTASLDPLTELMDLRPDDRVCVLGSVHATMGLYGAVHAVHALGEVILADEARTEATVAHAVPAAAVALLMNPPTGLRLIVVAGDRVPPRLCELAAQRGVSLLEYYGATELSFVAYRHVIDGRSAGGLLPFPGVQIRIEERTIWARSAYLAHGYHGAPDGPGRWVDGWATVGDRGSWRGDRLVIEGRGETAITVGGHTVHLADVEAFFHERMGALELAITEQEHLDLGAVPVGVLVGTQLDADRARELARTLPAPARPRRWIRVDALPRTAAGKVDRVGLRRLVHDA